jgi:hypothetical protein
MLISLSLLLILIPLASMQLYYPMIAIATIAAIINTIKENRVNKPTTFIVSLIEYLLIALLAAVLGS